MSRESAIKRINLFKGHFRPTSEFNRELGTALHSTFYFSYGFKLITYGLSLMTLICRSVYLQF